MTFYNSFIQFNLLSAFNFGNCLGASLGQRFWGNLWGQNANFMTNSFMMPSTSVFTPYVDNIPATPAMNCFDAFTYSNNSIFPALMNNFGTMNNFGMMNNCGMWNNYGGVAFTMQSFGTPSLKSVGNIKDLEWWKKQGYNAQNGEKLATVAADYTHYRAGSNKRVNKNDKKSPDEFTGKCAAYVGMAIRDSGLGDYPMAHGYQMADKLRQNSHFKEISPDGIDLKHLPAGCILCYNKGSHGYSREYGHVEISQPNGTATSDGTTHNIKKPDVLFIPV